MHHNNRCAASSETVVRSKTNNVAISRHYSCRLAALGRGSRPSSVYLFDSDSTTGLCMDMLLVQSVFQLPANSMARYLSQPWLLG